ncbi:unnamed protein product [Closterium sp. Yama58-4]|nr:unnamed protein product [Closterium sp. Yama58-4]
MSVLPPNYNLEVPKTVWRVRQAKARCVALQLPEGLQMFATTLCDIIERFGGAESCVILGDVTYGACCIDDVTAAALGADFLVHYGHSCLVPLDHTAIPCLYVFVDITIDVPHFIDTLKLNFPPTDHLVLAGTIQFTAAVHAAKSALSDHFRGISVPQAKPLSGGEGNPRTVDHCVRRIRTAGGTPVVFLVSELTPEKVAAVGVGSGGLMGLSETEAAGDVAGAGAGDVAGAGAGDVAGAGAGDVAGAGGGDVDRALGELSIERVGTEEESITSTGKEIGRATGGRETGIDAWVQVACPRLSIDWGEAFTAPMLTPYELEVALGFAPPWWGGCFCDSVSDSNVQGDLVEGKLRPSAAGSSKDEERALEKRSKEHEETAPKPQASSSSAAAAEPGKAKGEGKRPEEEEEGVYQSAGASKVSQEEKGDQLLDRTDMVHYLDVRNGWDLAACEPCFDRVVSRRTKLALGIHSLRDLRSNSRRQLKESVSLALPLTPSARQASSAAQQAKARAIEKFSSGVPLPEGALGGRQGVQSSRERYKWKSERAAGVCAEAMVLEWMAEPRVGVLMDLGMIRSRLPAILGAHMDSDSATFPGVMRQLGAVRREKEDQLASLLVQVLGVKEAGELKEGFGFFVENLLGVGATEFALAFASVISESGQRKQGEVFCMDAESASKSNVEDAAIEEARERLIREKKVVGREVEVGVGGAMDDAAAASSVVNNTNPLLTDPPVPVNTNSIPSLVPVNTNPIVSAMAYRVGCILQWVRIYGSDFISARRCFKARPQGKVLPMRHPLRDLPSVLVRLGAIPKPLPWKHFDSEWEEWPRGEEDAVKFPDDQSVRCFHLGIVEEAGVGDQVNKGSSKGGDRGSGMASNGGSGGRRGTGRDRGSGGKGGGGTHPARASPPPPQNRALPIVRCAADAHFLVEFAGHQVYPPACARCRSCLDQFTYHIPFLTLLANFAYHPATVLLNRFLSVFPPRSPEFSKLVDLLLLEPFPRGTCAAFQTHVVRERAEEMPIHFLLTVALADCVEDGCHDRSDRRLQERQQQRGAATQVQRGRGDRAVQQGAGFKVP